MCGIIGIAGRTRVADRLVSGLRRLEYRGYDSAGIAVATAQGTRRGRSVGKIAALADTLASKPIDGPVGIAHTRWATHGAATLNNAHPHMAGRVTIVHNGIIENYEDLRGELSAHAFTSETDTEIAAAAINAELDAGHAPREAFAAALKHMRGAYAFGAMIEGAPDTLFAARAGSPLAIGLGEGEMYLGSDAMALAELTDTLIYLEEGDWAVLTPDRYEIFDETDAPVTRDITVLDGGPTLSDKGNYPHFMIKEIVEQPVTLAKTLGHYVPGGTLFAPSGVDLANVARVSLVACGTAFYAAEVARYAFEQVARVACDTDIASEFRYRAPVLSDDTLFIVVSQSGETADTLAALRYAKAQGLATIALVNVMTSSMAREADLALPILAGPEIGVASTKAFTSQVTALLSLATALGQAKGTLGAAQVTANVAALTALPDRVEAALRGEDAIKSVAHAISHASSAFFLGRGPLVPIALEGALKLKEISYIHAEGYAAGELKHGPIALIEPGTPVIVIAPMDELFEKTVSNLQEVAARGAMIVLITDGRGAAAAGHLADHLIALPDAAELTAPLVMTVAVQLLAYHAAVHLGTDVDQPRNLAKSVTVE